MDLPLVIWRKLFPWLLFLPIRGLYHEQDFSVPVTSLVHDRFKMGQGLLLISLHELIYIALTLCKHACKVDWDVKSGVDPLPFWLERKQKMIGFSQVLKSNWGRIAFRTGAKFHFSEKILWGRGHFSNHVNSPSQDFTHQHERDSTKVTQQNLNVFADIKGIAKGLWLSKRSFKNRLFLDKITQKKDNTFLLMHFIALTWNFFVVNINAAWSEWLSRDTP